MGRTKKGVGGTPESVNWFNVFNSTSINSISGQRESIQRGK
jgi:hypothetical protein